MRLSARLIIVSVAAASALGLGLLFRHLDGPRVVARAVTPDGTEMCIIQRCNWSAEPFTTSFIYRKPGADWASFYYDHQDSYWGRGRVSLDMTARVAVFYRNNSPAVTFAWDTETYTLHRWNRTLTGAKGQMPTRSSSPRSVSLQN